MSFPGAVRLLLATWGAEERAPVDSPLAGIERGAFAAWARSHRGLAGVSALAPGDRCLTHDGRPGRVIEVLEAGRLGLACEALTPG